MTLEDFFTLTEMKDGLTAPSRVEELVTVMKRDKDFVTKNAIDATRHWTAVASTIAATDDRDCLNLFIQLDGLSFIDQWLRDAQDFGNGASDSFAEESITALLQALDKLQINSERSVSSGICITVKNLLGLNSARIQDNVRALLNSWNQGRVNDDVNGGVEKCGVVVVDKGIEDNATCTGETSKLECSNNNVSLSKGSSNEGIDGVVTAIARDLPSGSRDDLQPEGTKSLQSENSNNELPPLISSDHITREDRSSSALPSSFISKAARDISSTNENIPTGTGDRSDLIETCSNALSKDVNNEASGIENQKMDMAASTSSTREHLVSCGTGVESAEEIVTEAKLQSSVDANKNDCIETAALSDTRVPASEVQSSVDDIADHSAFPFQIKGQDSESHSNKLQGSSGISLMLEKPKHLDTKVSKMEETGTAEDGEHSSGGVVKPGSQDSDAQAKEVLSGPNHSVETDNGEAHSPNSNVLGAERETEMRGADSSQVTVAQEPGPTSEKSLCHFDLNQEDCSDDMELVVNSISNPISVESALKAEVIPGLPTAPLQFDGTLGWKGSAAASAFCPMSPHRNSDCDRMLSIGGTSSSSQHKPACSAFDLNIAESEEDKGADLMLGKQISASSGLRSAESSQEASTRRSEMFNLDLNQTSEDGDAPPSDLKVEKHFFLNRNGRRSPSPSSSSSSKQSSLRNIDLNDGPVLQINSSDKEPYFGRSTLNLHPFGGPKLDDPAISLMGTRVEVETNDFFARASSLPNGKALDVSVDARPGLSFGLAPPTPFPHSPAFGYTGLTPPPTMPFSSAVYGPGGSIPYMVNSRGAPVAPPQIMGSPIPSFSQPQFLMGMNGASLSLNGAASSNPNFDLNSGFGFNIEGGNRDPMGLRQQPLMPNQNRPFEDFLGVNSRPSSSGEKRKEPDSGWEPYPFPHRQQFPWK